MESAVLFVQREQQPETLKTYGFKSRNHSPQNTLLEGFDEKDLFSIVTSIKYRKVNNNFKKPKLYILKIKSSVDMFIFPDKSNNIYKINNRKHN